MAPVLPGVMFGMLVVETIRKMRPLQEGECLPIKAICCRPLDSIIGGMAAPTEAVVMGARGLCVVWAREGGRFKPGPM